MKEGCGGKTWPAGMVLAEYFLRCRLDTPQSKKLFVHSRLTPFQSGRRSILDGFHFDLWKFRLELGSGSGLVGYASSKALFSSCASMGQKTADTF